MAPHPAGRALEVRIQVREEPGPHPPQETQPPTTWSQYAPGEYGFYANVNPEVDHPRWTQSRERRIGELLRRKTTMFNGYPEVASLYAGMDLRKFY